MSEEEMNSAATKKLEEYNTTIQGVKEIWHERNISFIKGNRSDLLSANEHQFVLEEIARVLRLKPSVGIPKRAHRIILTGPPGSGRSLQA